MNKNLKYLIAILLVASFATLVGCKKEAALTIPQEQAHFANRTAATYNVLTANSVYKIPVGVTTVSTVDRTYTFSVSSPTGAVAGTQYTLPKTTVTIPAGKAIDSIEVRGILAAYQAGRKDTLVFSLTQLGKERGYNDSFKLALRGPCFEGDVDLNVLLGAYTKTNEDFGGAYGPYRTTISAVQRTGPTTGTITVTNIFDAGWNPVKVNLDWTNPAARTAIVPLQTGIGNAGTISAAQAGRDISVRPFAGEVGTFSVCSQTLTLKMQLGVTGLGFFGTLYTVTMAR